MTDLDNAHAKMEAAPGDDAARLRFFERLADTELFMLLTAEPEGDQIDPDVFDVEGQSFVLVFDRTERLTEFTGAPAPYAALSGRMLAQMLAGLQIGLGLNLDVAPSAMLIPADALGWLVDTLDQGPAEEEAQIEEIAPPAGLPEAVIEGVDRKLATATGLARMAYLVEVKYAIGTRGHLLAFIDAVPGAEPALASAVGEALTFSGVEAGAIDVAFFRASDPLASGLARHGLRFDLPVPAEPHIPEAQRTGPGMDPNVPPKLR